MKMKMNNNNTSNDNDNFKIEIHRSPSDYNESIVPDIDNNLSSSSGSNSSNISNNSNNSNSDNIDNNNLSTSTIPLHVTLGGIKVEDPNGNILPFVSLWENRRCVVVVFRRFGCFVCRLQALDVSCLKPQLDKLGISLIGIGFDAEGMKDFIDGNYFSGELFLDRNKSLYRTLRLKKMGLKATINGVAKTHFKIYRILRKEIPHDYKGDGWQLGGYYVMGPQPQGMHYEARQRTFADTFDMNMLLKACNQPYPEILPPHLVSKSTATDDEESKHQTGLDENITLPKPLTLSRNTSLHFGLPMTSSPIDSIASTKTNSNHSSPKLISPSRLSESPRLAQQTIITPLHLDPVASINTVTSTSKATTFGQMSKHQSRRPYGGKLTTLKPAATVPY
ncbi:hypothetical protein SAMD00019534_103920, partial [Acytostelium subglobosum LB1]|uniref:hypothetical protein n=1 Tax=Acytostelium subglobosum LB1 TaxID=1410327 RepID=UPI0006448169